MSRSRGGRAGLAKGRAKVARRGHGGPTLSASTGSVGQFSARSGGRGGGGYRGFKSKKQWKWAWASKQPFARKKAHETAGGYKRLPASKHSGHKGSRTPA